jgi:transposase
VAEPDQGPRPPSPTPLQASRSPAPIGPPAAPTATEIAGPGATGLWLSWRRLNPAQGGPGDPPPLRGPVPPFPGGPHPQTVRLEPPAADPPCRPAGRRSYPALERGTLARPEKKAREEGRTSVFIDETGCYLLTLVVKTYAPRGRTPVLQAPLSRDHLSVISGITHHGWLHAQVQGRPFRGQDAARFLRHLTTHISVRLLVVWDGSPIHRCQEVKAFLASPAGPGVHLEQLPAYAPELNPDEGVWNYLKRVELKNVICQHLGQLSFELGKALKRLRQKPHIIRACIAQAGLV